MIYYHGKRIFQIMAVILIVSQTEIFEAVINDYHCGNENHPSCSQHNLNF